MCGDDSLHYELTRNLLSLEWQHRTQLRRRGLFDGIGAMVRRGYYDDADDATDYARKRKEVVDAARDQAVRETDEPPGYAKPSLFEA